MSNTAIKEYHLDVNTASLAPQVLYCADHEATWPADFRRTECWASLAEYSSSPLGGLLVAVTRGSRAWIQKRMQDPKIKKTVPNVYLQEFMDDLIDAEDYFLQKLITDGVSSAPALHRWLEKYRYNVQDIVMDNETLVNAILYDDEIKAIDALVQKIESNAPISEAIALINDNYLTRFFSHDVTQLPDDFSAARITEVVREKLPGKIAFSNFFVHIFTEFDKRLNQAQKKLGQNIFQRAETYRLFPGIKSVTCKIDITGLPRIDLGRNFNLKNLRARLEDYPAGFIATPTEYYNERVVLPNRQFVHIRGDAARTADASTPSDRGANYARRGDNGTRVSSVCHKHLFIYDAKEHNPNATESLTNAEMMEKCNSLMAQPNNCAVLTLTPHPGPTGWPEMITVAPDLKAMKKFMTALYGEEISRERLINETFVMLDPSDENPSGVYSTKQALKEEIIVDLPAPSRSFSGGGGLGYPPRRGFRHVVKHGAPHDTSIYISN